MKSGTAQKLILNMLSTATMIRLGYVTGNRMTSVQTRNVKLRDRALRILMAETGLNEPDAQRKIDLANGDLRLALVMTRTGSSREAAEAALKKTRWVVAEAVRELSS